MIATRDYCHGMFNQPIIIKDKYHSGDIYEIMLADQMYHFQKNYLAAINLPSMVLHVFCGTYDGHCHGSLGTLKTTISTMPLDGFLYNKKAIW